VQTATDSPSRSVTGVEQPIRRQSLLVVCTSHPHPGRAERTPAFGQQTATTRLLEPTGQTGRAVTVQALLSCSYASVSGPTTGLLTRRTRHSGTAAGSPITRWYRCITPGSISTVPTRRSIQPTSVPRTPRDVGLEPAFHRPRAQSKRTKPPKPALTSPGRSPWLRSTGHGVGLTDDAARFSPATPAVWPCGPRRHVL
jgi:hypothetical protein